MDEHTTFAGDDEAVADDFERRMRAESASMRRPWPTDDAVEAMVRRLFELGLVVAPADRQPGVRG